MFGVWWLVVVGRWLVGCWLVVVVAVPRRTSELWESTKCRAYHAKHTGKAAETQRRQGDARAYTPPPTKHQVLRLPRKSHRQSGGDPAMPGRRQGVHPTPYKAQLRLPRKSHRQSGGDPATPGLRADYSGWLIASKLTQRLSTFGAGGFSL